MSRTPNGHNLTLISNSDRVADPDKVVAAVRRGHEAFVPIHY